jgi:hypothetical protein
MKINCLKSYIHVSGLIFAATMHIATVTAALTPAQQAAYDFVEEFINPEKNIATPFNHYYQRMLQIITMAKTENPQQLQEFIKLENQLNDLVTENNKKLAHDGTPVSPIKFGSAFKKFKKLLPGELEKRVEALVKPIRTKDLLSTFKTRLAAGNSRPHHRPAARPTVRSRR